MSTPRGTRRRKQADEADSSGAPKESQELTPAQIAVQSCYRLLTVRARSRLELEQALRRKEIPEDVIETVLGKFAAIGLIDDAAFADSWVRARHTHQGLGKRALAAELRTKGVADEVVAEAVEEVDDEAEEQRARELVRKRMRTTTGIDEVARIRRLVGVLARKGYPGGLAYRVVREELRAEGADADLPEEFPSD